MVCKLCGNKGCAANGKTTIMTDSSCFVPLEPQLTDLEKFLALYRGFGIKLTPYTNAEGQQVINMIEPYSAYTIDNPSSDKAFIGYNGFYSSVIFDRNGKFVSQGFWE